MTAFRLNLLFLYLARYELLHVLNFDPVRRRMSVIVRSKSGELEITVCFVETFQLTLVLTLSTQQVCVFLCVQVIHCFSVKGQTLPSFLVSDKRKSKGYACTWSVMQQWVTMQFIVFLLLVIISGLLEQHCTIVNSVQEGYRTLCVAYKILSADEYAQADAQLREARLALQDREEKLTAVYNQVETGMSLIGATAVEDRWVIMFHPALSCILLLYIAEKC